MKQLYCTPLREFTHAMGTLLQLTKESVEISYKYVNLQIFAHGTRDLIKWAFGRECYNVNGYSQIRIRNN